MKRSLRKRKSDWIANTIFIQENKILHTNERRGICGERSGNYLIALQGIFLLVINSFILSLSEPKA